MKTGLYIVATPIGNLNDISQRAIEILSQAEVIACEDTRVTKKLFSLLGISLKKNFISLHNFNEEEQAPKVIEIVENGQSVALVSDAGSPLISDPGYKLIKKCKEAGIYICTIPGCCAFVCALQLSGLPTNRFMFAGFIPNKEKARHDFFENLKRLDATLVFYETAPRILKTLQAAKEVFGEREMSVAREITKVYEECLTATPDELIVHFEEKEPRGEMVFMVAPFEGNPNEGLDVEKILKAELLKQKSLKDAVKDVVQAYKLNKNEVYELALRLKNES